MSLINTVKRVPTTVVGAYLSAADTGLSMAQRVAGQEANHEWTPRLVFEGWQAGVETRLGSLLDDPTLRERGQLRQAKLHQLRVAGELSAEAEARREQAEQKFEQRQSQAATRRKTVAKKAQQRQQAVKKTAEKRAEKIGQQAEQQAELVREVKQAQDEQTERQARQATLASLEEEATALRTQQQALSAERTVEAIGESIEASKQSSDNS